MKIGPQLRKIGSVKGLYKKHIKMLLFLKMREMCVSLLIKFQHLIRIAFTQFESMLEFLNIKLYVSTDGSYGICMHIKNMKR